MGGERERIFVWFSISSSLARTNTILKNEKSHGEDAFRIPVDITYDPRPHQKK